MTSNITSTHYGSTHRFTGRQGGSETILLKAGANEKMNIDLNGGAILNPGSNIFGIYPDAYIQATGTTLISTSITNNINASVINISGTNVLVSATNTLNLYGSNTYLFGLNSLNLYSQDYTIINSTNTLDVNTTNFNVTATRLSLTDTTSLLAGSLEAMGTCWTSTHSSVTGDTTVYTPQWDGVIYDRQHASLPLGGSYTYYSIQNTGIFTLHASIYLANLNSAHTSLVSYFIIDRSGVISYKGNHVCNPYACGGSSYGYTLDYTGILYASDKIKVGIAVSGGTKTVNILWDINNPGWFTVTYHRGF